MKNILLIAVLSFAAPVLGQSKMLQFIGDKSKMVYHPLACVEARQVDPKNSVPLFDAADAKDKGFSPATKCTKETKTAPAGMPSGAVPIRTRGANVVLTSSETFLEKDHTMPRSLLELQEKYEKFEFKPVVMHVYLSLSNHRFIDDWPKKLFYDHDAFEIYDGTAKFHVYMWRPRAKTLRELLIKRGGERVVATVSFIFKGKDYERWNIGELKDFQVYRDPEE